MHNHSILNRSVNLNSDFAPVSTTHEIPEEIEKLPL